jgi:hypothetical protein
MIEDDVGRMNWQISVYQIARALAGSAGFPTLNLNNGFKKKRARVSRARALKAIQRLKSS